MNMVTRLQEAIRNMIETMNEQNPEKQDQSVSVAIATSFDEVAKLALLSDSLVRTFTEGEALEQCLGALKRECKKCTGNTCNKPGLELAGIFEEFRTQAKEVKRPIRRVYSVAKFAAGAVR